MDNKPWYSCSIDEAIEYWQTDRFNGLSTKEVQTRLSKFGSNEMIEQDKISCWKRFIAQFQDFMVLVLLVATLISAMLGEYIDAITILAIVILNAILGFVQEYRAEQSLAALKKLTAPTARLLRNGMIQSVPAKDVVPGDIVILETGDRLAADGRLFEANSLELEESTLTGESNPTRKDAMRIFERDILLGDRKNMVYAGTTVTRGRGKAIVCATSMSTEVGRIAGMIQSAEEQDTPLQKRLEGLGRILVWGCLAVCLIVIVTGVAKGESLFLMCMAGISLAVAAIPEGLPAIVTVALALGVQRMIKRNAIIRKLPAVETLGCTTVICSDKTGTLTQNAMTVRKIYAGGKSYEVTGNGYDIKGEFLLDRQEFDIQKDKSLSQCLLIGTMCNNSIIKHNNIGISGLWRREDDNKGWGIEGDPTEGALVIAAAKADIWRAEEEKRCKRVAEMPFESERRRMSVVYRGTDGFEILYMKGAPDTILSLCNRYTEGNEELILTDALRGKIMSLNEEMTLSALRVLAVAYRPLKVGERSSKPEELENELIFAGLLGLIDPPREEAKQAVALCRQAGIKTVMITGDHRNTALAIAQELRIYEEKRDRLLTGNELDSLSDKELARIVNEVTVYARVSPAHKLRIVKALKQNGHIVAMTGDGVNDAPAIKEADIGVAMGQSGTDVTKEASSMILVDDNFATIVAAVEEGRAIYDNIRKFIRYLLSCNTGEVITMFGAAVAGLPLPLLPVQILWVNLVTDGLPAMALGIDGKDGLLMNKPPRNSRESIFSRGLSRKIITRGIQIGLSTLGVFYAVYYLRNDLALARTMSFATLVFCQMFHVFDCRSEFSTIFKVGIFSNIYLVIAVMISSIMQLSVIYHPLLRSVFCTVPLSIYDWLLILTVSGWTFIISGFKYLFWGRRSMRTAFSRNS